MPLTFHSSSAIFNPVSVAMALAGDRQALNQLSRRASAIVIKSGAFLCAHSMTVWPWMPSGMSVAY
jgi:hypothetical protein